jgi:hypothetical protein
VGGCLSERVCQRERVWHRSKVAGAWLSSTHSLALTHFLPLSEEDQGGGRLSQQLTRS